MSRRDYVTDALTLHTRRWEALQQAAERERADWERRQQAFAVQAVQAVGELLSRGLASTLGAPPEAPEFTELAWELGPHSPTIHKTPDGDLVLREPTGLAGGWLQTTFQGIPVDGHIDLPAEGWDPSIDHHIVPCRFAIQIEQHWGEAVPEQQPG